MMMGSMLKDETANILQEMVPYVSALSMQYTTASDKEAEDVKAVVSLVEFMRRHNARRSGTYWRG